VRTLIGLVQASHPFPLAAVVALTGLIGVASAGEDLDLERLAGVLLAMLLAQLVIGWTNDYADRETDARHQPSKPIPAGRASANLVAPLAVVAAVGALAVALTLGIVPMVCAAIGIACGLAYNFKLKATAVSWLPYVVAFCVLPPFVWSGLDVWDEAFLALYPIALPLTVAAHFANALPDIETDRAAGSEGFVVVVGRSVTLRLMRVILVLPVGLIASSTAFVSYDLYVLAAALVAYGMLILWALFAYGTALGQRSNDVWGFRLVVAASLVFVTGWLVAVK
jgi:4-hydroxybenzoate polyprenyltransferase